MEHLECVFCNQHYPLNVFNPFCPDCREPLLFPIVTREEKILFDKSESLEKFIDFLPIEQLDRNLFLGEGNTPLLRLQNLMNKFDLPLLYAKDESRNPTLSFKDRGTAVAIQKAVSLNISKIGTVSVGNMASSTAAYGAKAGLNTYVFVKEAVSQEKLLSACIFNPFLIQVKGDYGDLFEKSFSIGKKHDIYFINSVDPFRIEGYKLAGLETFVQLDQKAPKYVFVPVSSGGHLIGLMKAFFDLKSRNLIQEIPKFIGVQAECCSPLAKAYRSEKFSFERIRNPQPVPYAICNPNPPGGNIVLKWIRQNNGIITNVSDEEILHAQRLLAEYEGIFCLPASASTLAGFLKLSKNLNLTQNDTTVLVLTGSGLKGLKLLNISKTRIFHSTISTLEHTIRQIV